MPCLTLSFQSCRRKCMQQHMKIISCNHLMRSPSLVFRGLVELDFSAQSVAVFTLMLSSLSRFSVSAEKKSLSADLLAPDWEALLMIRGGNCGLIKKSLRLRELPEWWNAAGRGNQRGHNTSSKIFNWYFLTRFFGCCLFKTGKCSAESFKPVWLCVRETLITGFQCIAYSLFLRLQPAKDKKTQTGNSKQHKFGKNGNAAFKLHLTKHETTEYYFMFQDYIHSQITDSLQSVMFSGDRLVGFNCNRLASRECLVDVSTWWTHR